MRSSKVKLDGIQSGTVKRTAVPSIASLREYYHSIHDAERAQVIELLGDMKEPEAGRELIQIFEECEWRATKFQVIQALERNPTSRSLEFLFSLAQDSNDIFIAEAAIRSLGQTHHRLAALFLIHYYQNCAKELKPSIIGALGQIPDRTLVPSFLSDLPIAIKNNQIQMIKNLVVTLAS
jgi:HEAT repeat protein